MKNLIFGLLGVLALPTAAFAEAGQAPPAEKCCCEKMKGEKPCCDKKSDADQNHQQHQGHEEAQPKS